MNLYNKWVSLSEMSNKQIVLFFLDLHVCMYMYVVDNYINYKTFFKYV